MGYKTYNRGIVSITNGMLISLFEKGDLFLRDILISDDKIERLKIKRALKILEKKGFIGLKELEDETIATLKRKGKKKALMCMADNLKIKKPEKWDKKWRIVIFDIPHEKKNARDALKKKLRNLGFKMMQKSVYIFPFDCVEEINFLRSVYEIRSYVTLITADKVEDEEKLIKAFNIK